MSSERNILKRVKTIKLCRILAAIEHFLKLTFLVILSFSFSCQQNTEGEAVPSDSSLIQTAYAKENQAENQQNNDDIYHSRHNAITHSVAKVSPAVVGINVTQVRQYVQRNPWSSVFPELYRDRMFERKVESVGSGFIISRDGYIVTNEHVVSNATEIVVAMTDGEHLNATLIGSDALTDSQ